MDNVTDNSLTDTIQPIEIPESTFHLTVKQQKFIEAYKKTGDATKSAISAGYALKSAYVEGSRLLKSAKILAELKHWKTRKASEITKDDYIDIAMQSFKSLDVTEPNSPRFYDIAGKALGYIGNTQPQAVTNNTQINIKIDGTQSDLWQSARSLLGQ